MAVPLHQVAGVVQYIVFAVAAALTLFFLVHVRWKQGNGEGEIFYVRPFTDSSLCTAFSSIAGTERVGKAILFQRSPSIVALASNLSA
jgi:hypothetical protein